MKSSLFSRYTCFVLSILLALASLTLLPQRPWFWLPALLFGCLSALGIYNLTQQRHAICRNYPIIGRLRFFFEFIRRKYANIYWKKITPRSRSHVLNARWSIAAPKMRWATSHSVPNWTFIKRVMNASAIPCAR